MSVVRQSDGETIQSQDRSRPAVWPFGLLVTLSVWAYWNSLEEAALAWRTEQYSHGLLMPVAAVALLWLRRLGGRLDWRPVSRAEQHVLLLTAVFLGLAGLMHLAAARISMAIAPSNLAGGIFASAVGFFAAVFYALGLVILAVGSARSWLLQQQESQDRTQASSGTTRPAKLRPARDFTVNLSDADGTRLGAGRTWLTGHLVGLSLIVLGTVFRLGFSFAGLEFPSMLSFIVVLSGVVTLGLGPKALRWSWPAAVMLLFAFPLPFSVERAVLVPLQGIAASAGTYFLQILGLDAINEGAHFIKLGDIQLGVVEQCSGLRMATVFLALVLLYLFLVEVPRWQIPVLLISAVPIAVFVNVLRITVTGVLYVYVGADWAQRVFHDWAGFLMPLVAVFLLLVLRAILDWLIILEEESSLPLPQRL